MSPLLESLKEFLLSDDNDVQFFPHDKKLKCAWLSVNDVEIPNDKYFYLEYYHDDVTSIRARYKLPGMEEESTIVVDVLRCTNTNLKLMIRSMDRFEIEYELNTR